MDTAMVTEIFRGGIDVAIKLGAPILLLCMAVGVLTAIFQAVTQIHEQSLAFVIKLVAVILVLVIGGGWMMQTLKEYALSVFDMMLR